MRREDEPPVGGGSGRQEDLENETESNQHGGRGEEREDEDGLAFGNEMREKSKDTFRVCYWNIGGWPLNIADPKNKLLKQEIL